MKRNPEETYEAFRARRLKANQDLKQYLRGKLVHASRDFYDDPDGKIHQRSVTYRKPENV
jgi:hypothetical protein